MVRWLLLALALLRSATSQLYHEYNVAIGIRHQNHRDPNKPDCSAHFPRIQRRVDKAVAGFVIYQRRGLQQSSRKEVAVNNQKLDFIEGPNDNTHRKLSDYDHPHCRKFCYNIARGYCYIASGGYCDDYRRRKLRTAPRRLYSNSFMCSTRINLVSLEMLMYAITLDQGDICRSWLFGPWDYTCLDVST